MLKRKTALTTADINFNDLNKNIHAFKKIIDKNTKLMAVIKANAYGHGAIPLAKEMEEKQVVDYFGVAQFNEALELREHAIETKILIFNSIQKEDIQKAIEKQVTLTVFTVELAKQIVHIANKLKMIVNVHLKIDTGMARLGVNNFLDAKKVYQALQSPYVNIEGIYTHFADAAEITESDFTKEQFNHFKQIIHSFKKEDIDFPIQHACNTAGTINFPEYHLDMVRVGFGLYGYNPTQDTSKINLQPIQKIRTTITNIKDFPANKSVGYDRTYYSNQPMKIATIAMGYADGVPFSLTNKGLFTLNGQQLPIVGRVCMDQIMLDSSAIQNLKIGDEVFYFDDPRISNIYLEDIANTANTSPYELLCRIGPRVKRNYLK